EFDLYRVKIRAKTETVYYPLSDLNSEEIILVEKGDLSICNNQGGEVVLNAGDSMRLVSDYRYKIKNPSTQDTSALYFVSSHKDIFKKRML
ncbi:MAG: XRE family transcriptional regulator, partial [Peptostreptococcus sp.]|nr:XRE family transcriptional regulator [Peptostreptococcus sp.]